MLRSVMVGLTALLAAVWLPRVLLDPLSVVSQDHRLLIVEQAEEPEATETMLLLHTADQIVSIPLETYLIGVMVGEMPLSFHTEALKAQAIAARTFTMRQLHKGKHDDYDLCDQSSCCQAWIDPEQLEYKLGDSENSLLDKAKEAVVQTKGKVLTYRGELIDAVYFSCSGGITEAAAAVWGSEVPYLQSVNSPGEETAARYKGEVLIGFEEFKNKLPKSDFSGLPASWFGATVLTEGQGVAQIEIGGIAYTGTELRSMFGLNSTMFEIAVTENGILFETKGFGHRVGMSQYGANAMAQEGNTYEQILLHYYPGTSLQ